MVVRTLHSWYVSIVPLYGDASTNTQSIRTLFPVSTFAQMELIYRPMSDSRFHCDVMQIATLALGFIGF